MKRPLAAALLALLSLFAAPAAPSVAEEVQIADLGTAINVAGRQRMLSQRIVKAYGLVLLEVEYDRSLAQMNDAIALFDRQLAGLKAFPTDAVIQGALASLEQVWQPFKRAATATPLSQEGLQALVGQNEQVLQAAHQVVVLLEQRSGVNAGRLVNIAGRQRMLSQRIAKFYMLIALGSKDPAVREGLRQAAGEFRQAMRELSQAQENTPQIQEHLRQVERQWTLFEAAFNLEKGETAPLLLARSSEKVLTLMNDVTGLYAGLDAVRVARNP